MVSSVTTYIDHGHYSVPGYTSKLDLKIISEILQWQTKTSISGALVEIGVHHGRSFICLAMHRQPGERLGAFDLFEDDDMNPGVHANRSAGFFANIKKWNVRLEADEVHKGDSLKIDVENLRASYRPVRFFSIDGGHRYVHVSNDLSLARAVLHDKGIICVDDWMNPVWPEVSHAALDFLRDARGEFVGAVSTQAKLYICRRDAAGALNDLVPTLAGLGSGREFRVSLGDDEPLYLKQKSTGKLIEAVRSHLGR